MSRLDAGKCRFICAKQAQMKDATVPNRIVDNEDVGKGPCLAAVSRTRFCGSGYRPPRPDVDGRPYFRQDGFLNCRESFRPWP